MKGATGGLSNTWRITVLRLSYAGHLSGEIGSASLNLPSTGVIWTRSSPITFFACHNTSAIVSPGRRRKLTVAIASAGIVLSSTPPWMIVRAVVVRMLAFISGMAISQRRRNGPQSQMFAKATCRQIGRRLADPVIHRPQPAQVRRHGMGFQAGQGARQDADRGLGRRGGGMPRLAADRDLDGQVALLAHADQPDRAAHAGGQPFRDARRPHPRSRPDGRRVP